MMSLSDVEPLDRPQYEELSSITRSLHLRPAMASYGKQRLISHKIVSKTVNLNVKVLWFAPTRPMTENNMYGNVSFTLDWKTALEQLGPYLYYIDQQENGEFIYSRVLLTKKKYDFLTLVDEDGHRMPMLKFAGKHYAATACEDVKHVLEIGVEVDLNREKWLYMNCKVQANDHSSANTLLHPGGPYNSCFCHRFNYFKNECPSPYKLQRTKKILEKRCPTMLRDGPAGTSPSTHITPRKKKQVEVVYDEGYDDDDEEGYEVYDFVPGYDDHTVVHYTATARRITTTKVEVVERAAAVRPKTITPVTTPSSTTNVRTLGFASASVISGNAASYRSSGSPSSSVGHTSGAISSSTASLRTIGSPPSLNVGHTSGAISSSTASFRTIGSPPSSSVGHASGAISSSTASFRTIGSPPSLNVGHTSGAISSSTASFRTVGSPPSASVGHTSGAISSSTASFRTIGSPPSASVRPYSSSTPGYTNYSNDLYRTPSTSGFASGTPQKNRDEGLSAGEKVLVGALVAGGVALFAGLASLFGGGDDKKKRLEKNNSWWS